MSKKYNFAQIDNLDNVKSVNESSVQYVLVTYKPQCTISSSSKYCWKTCKTFCIQDTVLKENRIIKINL